MADGLDGSVPATQSFTLAPVNDQPIANAGSSTTDEDTAVSGRVTGSDVESGAALTYALVSGPQHGTLVFDPSGDYTYTPGADYFGWRRQLHVHGERRFADECRGIDLAVRFAGERCTRA